jgi:hypothetical protein
VQVRTDLTDTQLVDLLQNAPALTLTGGMELVDLSLEAFDDISGDLRGGEIERQSYATMHGTARFQIARQLDWGAALVRPYIIVGDGGSLSARFNLGVYHTSTPAFSLKESPPTFDVEGYDILLRLAQPVGNAYAIPAGDAYLTHVAEILTARGYLEYVIDQDAAAVLAPGPRVWAFDDTITWLTIVNDLLASVGYAGIWSDWDGRLRCEPYQRPIDRSWEWVYTDDKRRPRCSASTAPWSTTSRGRSTGG